MEIGAGGGAKLFYPTAMIYISGGRFISQHAEVSREQICRKLALMLTIKAKFNLDCNLFSIDYP